MSGNAPLLLQYIPACLVDLLPDVEKVVLPLLRHLSIIHLLSKLTSHTESTLLEVSQHVEEFGRYVLVRPVSFIRSAIASVPERNPPSFQSYSMSSFRRSISATRRCTRSSISLTFFAVKVRQIITTQASAKLSTRSANVISIGQINTETRKCR